MNNVAPRFIEKVYLWAPDWSSYMGSLYNVAHSISSLTIVPFLIRVLKLNDVPLSIIGLSATYTKNMLMGTWLSSTGKFFKYCKIILVTLFIFYVFVLAFYIGMPFNSVSGLASIGSKSFMTKIVDRDELGKVNSFMTTVDSLLPMIGTVVYTYIFKYTIDSYPGLVYQITAMTIILPILLLIWLDLYTEPPVLEGHEKNNNHKKDICKNELANNSKKDNKSKKYDEKSDDNNNGFNTSHEIYTVTKL